MQESQPQPGGWERDQETLSPPLVCYSCFCHFPPSLHRLKIVSFLLFSLPGQQLPLNNTIFFQEGTIVKGGAQGESSQPKGNIIVVPVNNSEMTETQMLPLGANIWMVGRNSKNYHSKTEKLLRAIYQWRWGLRGMAVLTRGSFCHLGEPETQYLNWLKS